MAKICPLTNEKILYVECLECEEREKCRSGNLDKNGKNEGKE